MSKSIAPPPRVKKSLPRGPVRDIRLKTGVTDHLISIVRFISFNQ